MFGINHNSSYLIKDISLSSTNSLLDWAKNNKIVQLALGIILALGATICLYRIYKEWGAIPKQIKVKPSISKPIPDPANLKDPSGPISDVKSVLVGKKSGHLPKVSSKTHNWSSDFIHVKILNEQGYIIDGKEVKLQAPTKPVKVEIDRDKHTIETYIETLREDSGIKFTYAGPKIQVVASTTDQAIANGDQHKIALNFANPHHAGGGPNIHKDNKTGLLVWGGGGSAKAQEEALVAKSTLLSSLLLLGTHSEHKNGDSMIRNYFVDDKGDEKGFDSTKEAYISDDQLFAVGGKDAAGNNEFYCSDFLEKPRNVSFITSAAQYYGGKDVPIGLEVWNDAKLRIQTHLYAAALKAVELKKKDPSQPVELIIGAFGCGAFAPGNVEGYVNMIASTYKEVLPYFNGFFDLVTVAIPTNLGSNKGANESTTKNFNGFKEVFNNL